jgi:TPR repeat protein
MGRRPPNKTNPPPKPGSNTSKSQQTHNASSNHVSNPTATTNPTNNNNLQLPFADVDPFAHRGNIGPTAYDEAKYAQYLKDRANHLDELDATYQSWQSSTDPQVLFNLAMIYINDSHPSYPPNAETALKYLQLAAAQDHDEAAAYIALFHLAGIVFPQNAATAYSILQKRAETECAPSMLWLSTIHLCNPAGAIVKAGLDHFLPDKTFVTDAFNPDKIQFASSDTEAIELLLRSGQSGHGPAQEVLAARHWININPKYAGSESEALLLSQQYFHETVHWTIQFTQSPDQMRVHNNGGVSLHLRDALAYIDSAEHIDNNELKKLLRPACDEGSTHAYYLRGLVHQKESADWPALDDFLKAAVRGSSGALYEIGFHHYTKSPPDYTTAAHWFQQAIEQGNRTDAVFFIAQMYQEGRYFTTDINTAMLKLYPYAATHGHQSSQLCLGALHQGGRDVPVCFHQSAKWYTEVLNTPLVPNAINHVTPYAARSHAENIGHAHIQLGSIYMSGNAAGGFAACQTTALKHLKLAAESGRVADLGLFLSSANYSSPLPPELLDDTTAVKWLTAAVKQDDTNTRIADTLAVHLYEGLGTDFDVRGAVALWRKALNLGSHQAAYFLGALHYDGDHPHIVPTNKQEGLRLLTIAAERGAHKAQIRLGFIYNKSGAHSQAEKWFTAASFDAMGKYDLAKFYHTTSYVPPKMTEKQADLKILNNYSLAAKSGVMAAKLDLAILFIEGFRSIPISHEKALTYLAMCINDDPHVKTQPSSAAVSACFYFGLLAQVNFSFSRVKLCMNFDHPHEWLDFGAKHGVRDCQLQLATMYYEGSDCLKQDYTLASYWLDKCLKQGHRQDSVSLLGKMQHRGVFVPPPESDEEDE